MSINSLVSSSFPPSSLSSSKPEAVSPLTPSFTAAVRLAGTMMPTTIIHYLLGFALLAQVGVQALPSTETPAIQRRAVVASFKRAAATCAGVCQTAYSQWYGCNYNYSGRP